MAKKCKVCGCKNPFPLQSTCPDWECQRAWEDKKGKTKKTNVLAKVSGKRAAQLRKYVVLKKEWIAEHPFCFPCKEIGMKTKATDVHHMKGRQGGLLTDTEFWLPVCRSCHRRITDDSKWAIEQGYSLKRNS